MAQYTQVTVIRDMETVTIKIDEKVEFTGDAEELRTILRQHKRLMDRIDSMPADGGRL